MAKFTQQFETLLGEIRRNETSKVLLPNAGLTTEDARRLAEAMRENDSVTMFWINMNEEIGDDGLIALCGALKDHPRVLDIDFDYTGMGDKSAGALAELLSESKTILRMGIPHHQMSKAGEKTVESVIGKNKNLIHFNVSTGTRKYADENQYWVTHLRKKLPDIEQATPDDWFEIAERWPSISIGRQRDQNQRTEAFLSSLPEIATSAQTLEEILLAPRGESGHAPIDNPKTWQEFGQTLATLNQKGIQLRGRELLSDGKPTALYETVIRRGKAGALFCEANLKGAGLAEVKALLRHAPEEAVANRHALLAAVGQQACSNPQRGLG